jgi:hypothetical protein
MGDKNPLNTLDLAQVKETLEHKFSDVIVALERFLILP